MSHTEWVAAILKDETVTPSLYSILRNGATKTITSIDVNQEVYLDIVKSSMLQAGQILINLPH